MCAAPRSDTPDDFEVDEVRLVEFFDELIERGAGPADVLEAAAGFAGCTVGLRTTDGVFDLVCGADRRGGRHRLSRELSTGDEVWLVRPGGTTPLDELLLKRLSVACGVALRHLRSRLPKVDDPALVELVVGDAAGEPERARALALLGYSAVTLLRVVAIVGEADDVRQVIRDLGDVHATTLGSVHVVVTAQEIPEDLAVPVGTRISIGPRLPGMRAPCSWRAARTCLRFAMPSTHPSPPYPKEEAAVVDAASVGCFALLAEHLPADAIAETAEVEVLDRLAGEPGGPEMLRTLEAVAATESLRRAAASLHMHHNSVSARVARAEQLLGFEITQPYGRVRMMFALILRRLRDSDRR
ncbi:helix-turn-helix domain-containing protein [Amycolatopsis thermophila]|uniref:PucR C-terminal helix-turn-helix domain-containing protein n=1 Tax=Amycolatopsis thermophila TaxID=206084 RepID=A0ABU0F5I4_9PSEU|nr:helix-turn-helix domain-containing protein [Amycolatopsis thermophila]MDQ0382850.1 hypothetical protein [Amycolatopsis thermophila]